MGQDGCKPCRDDLIVEQKEQFLNSAPGDLFCTIRAGHRKKKDEESDRSATCCFPTDHREGAGSSRGGRVKGVGDCQPDYLAEPALALDRQRLLAPHEFNSFAEHYRLGNRLGVGSFGKVYEARPWLAATGGDAAGGPASEERCQRVVAVKIFSLVADNAPEAHVHRSSSVPPLMSRGVSSASDSARNRASSVDRLPVATAMATLSPLADRDSSSSTSRNQRWAVQERLPSVSQRRMSFTNEHSLLAQIDHPHIVRMYEVFEEADALYIVSEVCLGGELTDRLNVSDVLIDDGKERAAMAKFYFKQMLLAVSHLHAHNILHRDLKVENFLLLGMPGSPEEGVLKLCDFGAAVQLKGKHSRAANWLGTLSYMAPEIFAGFGAALASDSWSLGVILYILLVGLHPFRKSSRKETMRRIVRCEMRVESDAWMVAPDEAKDLVESLLMVEESRRMHVETALGDPWLAETAPAEELPTTFLDHAPRVLRLVRRLCSLNPVQQLGFTTCALLAPDAGLAYARSGDEQVPWYAMFRAMDVDSDGVLSYAEFLEGLRSRLGLAALSDEEQHGFWHALDLDSSGSIEWFEWLALALLDAWPLPSPDLLDAAFRLLDRDSGDGTITDEDIIAVCDDNRGNALHSSNVTQLLKFNSSAVPLSMSFEDFSFAMTL
mmetsp:Transcript_8916/g.19615  ORF Transcript_8916/g.19615 Transcript_8916/m.19615 type:complete len:663 (+) Transcript_8916:78-2066(+)